MLTTMVPALGSSLHETRPRPDPPPQPPLTFPRCTTSSPKHPLTPANTRSFHSVYTTIKKPTDIRPEHLDRLNVSIEHDVPLEDLIPLDPSDGTSPLPPSSWNTIVPQPHPHPQTPDEEAKLRAHRMPEKLLSTGKPAPNIETYMLRLAELSYPNDAVFHVVQRRRPIPGQPPARPGQYYRFWQALDLVAQWWDTSEDEKCCAEPDPETGFTYIGRRIGKGGELPEAYREDCIRGFVEVIGWEFGCRLQAPRTMPRLAVRTSLFPSRFTSIAYRQPATTAEQRSGILEGPVLAIQCRPETMFRQPGDEVGKGQAEILDQLREIVGALILAQERAREGKEEKRPGVGKWWCEAPRWGGGPGGEVGAGETKAKVDGNGNEAGIAGADGSPAAGLIRDLPSLPPHPGRGRSGSRGNKLANFKKLDKQSSGTWDKKVRYLGIGKDVESGVDDIFLTSSVNHHISIIHLRVSNSYLRFLESGALPRTPVSPSSKTQQTTAAADVTTSSNTNDNGNTASENNASNDNEDAMDISPPSPMASGPGTTTNGKPTTSTTHNNGINNANSSSTNKEGKSASLPQDWYNPKLRRSRWFNLLDKDDRIEAMRGIWGVFGYLMRATATGNSGAGAGGASAGALASGPAGSAGPAALPGMAAAAAAAATAGLGGTG